MSELSDYLKHASDDVKELNADKLETATSVTPQQQESRLEARFATIWHELNGVQLEREYQFHPERKWRFDFAHPYTQTAFEVEGGVWSQGRHTRGAGFIEDCEKYNEAARLGWTVVRLPNRLLNHDYLFSWVTFVREVVE